MPSELIDGLRTSKQITNLLDDIFVSNILRAIDDLLTGLDNNDAICNHMRKHFGFPSDDAFACVVKPTFTAKIQDKNVTVKLPEATLLRPIQEHITVEDPAPLLVIGSGWASEEGKRWFESNPKERKCKATTPHAIEEDKFILKTMTHIKWLRTNDGPREYKFKCDMRAALENDLTLTNKFQHLIEQD